MVLGSHSAQETSTPPRIPRWFLAALIALASVGIPPNVAPLAAATSWGSIGGSATYRERVALTPQAVLEAILEDVSRPDAPPERIARVRLKNPGQVPIAFEIRYDPRKIEASHRYMVRVSIDEGGQPLFVGVQSYPVLTHGHGDRVQAMMRGAAAPATAAPGERGPGLGELPATFGGLLPCADCAGIRYRIDLAKGGGYVQRATYLRSGHDDSYYEVGAWSLSSDRRTVTLDGGNEGKTFWELRDTRTLRKLDRQGKPIDSQLPYELTRQTEPGRLEPRARLTGMFRAMADAPRFHDCHSGFEWPVAMTGDYLALERACRAQGGEPGAELMVTIEARIEQRPRPEGEGSEAALVVEKFHHAKPGEKCAGRTQTDRSAQEDLLGNNRWVPLRIGEQEVVVPSGQREPWIVLEPGSRGVTGSGGCNRFSGGYESGDGTLRFDAVASTQMACPAMKTETDFLVALEATRRYRVHGRTLELMDDHGRVLVRLEERNLK